MLDRVIFNGVPTIPTTSAEDLNNKIACRPYIQIFKNGSLIFSSLDQQEVKEFSPKDLSCVFKVGVQVENDVLLRCRHFASPNERISMFRLYFHTSFVSGNILRFSKAMIDGAHDSENYPADFFVDLIFTEPAKTKTDPEDKDMFWKAIGKICKEKREMFEKNEAAEEEKRKEKVAELVKQKVPETAFVIDEKKEEKKEDPKVEEAKKEIEEGKMEELKRSIDVAKLEEVESTEEEEKKTEVAIVETKKEEEVPKQKSESAPEEPSSKEESKSESEDEDVDKLLERIENEVLP